MRHKWREVRGSFDARTRVADFKCEACGAFVVDRPGSPKNDFEECPFSGNPPGPPEPTTAKAPPAKVAPDPGEGQLELLRPTPLDSPNPFD